MIKFRLVESCLFLLLCMLFLSVSESHAQRQANNVEFGKNRVQYHDDFKNWDRYESQNFITYWYGKARQTAIATFQIAEHDHSEIRSILEHRMNEKIELIVYSDVTDLHQTNIGNNEIFETKPGETTVVGNKLFVYFDGRTDNLRRQIRTGISRVYLYQMLLGSNWEQFFNYLSQTEYPDWYLKGIVKFIAEGWNIESDDELRALVLADRYEGFYDLAGDRPRLAGQLFWYYVTQKYGSSVLANILYSNRINRSIESSFDYVVGRDFEEIVEEAWQKYQQIYSKEGELFPDIPESSRIPFKNKYHAEITQVEYHPSGEFLAFVDNEQGKWKIRYYYPGEKKPDKIIKKGQVNPFQITDTNYPMIQWGREGEALYIIYEKRDVIYLQVIDLEGDEIYKQPIAPNINRIYDFDVLSEFELILSANISGFSDLVKYEINTRQTPRINADFYDDLSVTYGIWLGKKGVFFSSNRNGRQPGNYRRDTIVPTGTFDIYFLAEDQWDEDNPEAQRLTNTPDIQELQLKYAEDALYYIQTKSGKKSLKKFKVKADDEIIMDFIQNIQEYDIHENNVSAVMLASEKDQLYKFDMSQLQEFNSSRSILVKPKGDILDYEEEKSYDKSKEILGEAPKFQSEFPDPPRTPFDDEKKVESKKKESADEVISLIDLNQSKKENSKRSGNIVSEEFNSPRVVASRLHFKTTGINMDFNNEPLYDGLDSYAGQRQGYEFQPFGLLLKSRIYDIFEDYEFVGGARFPLEFNGSEYFLTLRDKKYQWDKIYGFYRKAERYPDQIEQRESQIREINTIGTFELRYPFDMFRSIRLRATFRLDKLNSLAVNQQSLNTPSMEMQRIGLRAEYVFDNTYDLMYNMKVGSRYKLYIEGLNRFTLQFDPWEISASDAFMTIIGLDARHYIRLNKHMTLNGRLAGVTSFGSEQILFYMGGVDNWLFSKASDQIAIPSEGNFVYNGLAANVRGFKQNARNGATYALGNIELRVCPLNYISKKPLRSTFLKNFMLIGFFDTGTAWYGISPYSDENPLNKVVIDDDPVIAGEITYFRDPLIVGYGMGARVNLYGFYLRFDYAWGIDTKVRNDGLLYFSMGKDF